MELRNIVRLAPALACAALVATSAPAALGVEASRPAYDPNHTAKEWVPLFAEDWWNHFHPDYQAWYPGGRSNRFHDAWIGKVMVKHARTKDWEIINKAYAFDGQWFAVEWHYRSTYLDDGFRQWETTLAFARIHEGKKILWIENFDDAVGSLQKLGLMPLCEPGEPVAPWPAKATETMRMPYRP